MNIEITHDVDHLGVADHLHDLALPRFLTYQAIKVARGLISFREFAVATREIIRSAVSRDYDTWENFEEWIALHRQAGVPGTWFFACRPGLGMTYGAKAARPYLERLRKEGHQIGLHSQCRDDLGGLRKEMDEFCDAYGLLPPLPVRMHYLAKAPDHEDQMQAYRDIVTYDSSIFHASQTAARGDFIRPINVMDGYREIGGTRPFDPLHAKSEVLALCRHATKTGHWVMLDFHQRVLSPCFARNCVFVQEIFAVCSEK